MKNNDEKDLLEPVDITAIGSDKDPCFGKGFDLRTKECQSCGDSELCVMKTSQKLGKTREELELKSEFLDSSISDEDGIKKLIASEYSIRGNVWEYDVRNMGGLHPAMFPEKRN